MSNKKVMTIDLEPTWEQLCRMSQSGALRPVELLPACKIADIVRQAQKAGKENVLFTFENGEVSVTDEPARIAALEADKAKLIEVLGNVLEAYNGCQCGCDPDNAWHEARAVLAEVTNA